MYSLGVFFSFIKKTGNSIFFLFKVNLWLCLEILRKKKSKNNVRYSSIEKEKGYYLLYYYYFIYRKKRIY